MFKKLHQLPQLKAIQNRIEKNMGYENNFESKQEKKGFQSVEESAHWISYNLKKIKELLERLVDLTAMQK